MALRGEDGKGHLNGKTASSRRFYASYIQSSREDHKSSKNAFSISSTASSPRYSLTEEIDPSNYSFTSALKALQAKTVYKKNRDWLKPVEGIELSSKWNEAEKYICNPLSGEVPKECLSSKTLNSRSFRDVSNMSTPLRILPSNHKLNNPRMTNPNVRIIHEDPVSGEPVLIQEKKVVGLKRDVGVQSAPVNVSPGKTPPMMERSTKRKVNADDSPVVFALELKAQQEDAKLEEEKKEKKKRGSRFVSWMNKKAKATDKIHMLLSHLCSSLRS